MKNKTHHWTNTAVVALAGLLSLAMPTAAQDAQPNGAEVEETFDAEQTAVLNALDTVEVEQVVAEVEPTDVVGWLELSGTLREGPVPFAWISEAELGPSMKLVVSQLQKVAEDDRYLGVVVYLDEPELTLTQTFAVIDAIKQVRAAGKQVYAFAESYDMTGYLIASSCDEILLQHKGVVFMMGLSIEEWYFAGLLDKIGAHADMMQIGKYKGASDPFTRTEPSPEWSENFDGLLDDLYDQIVTQIADGRGMTRAQAEAAIGDSWTLTDEQLVQRGVVDRLVKRDLIDVTEVVFGDNFEWDDQMGAPSPSVDFENPFAVFGMLFSEPVTRTTGPTLAVVHARGPIHSGESSRGDGLFSGDSIGSRTVTTVLAETMDNENIMGVVIRVDSPGGSALASEVIWQAVRELAEIKPVYISVGRLAASGGYYIACAGDEVYVAPQSIVGSIGVVSGKLTLTGLYEWAGLSVYRRSRGPLADMFNSVEPFTEQQRAALMTMMQNTYDQFVDRVTIGRGNRLPDVDRVDEGMLFTGRAAIDNGLADKIGDTAAALRDMADQLGLEEGEYEVIHLPHPMSLQRYLAEVFGGASIRSPDLGGNTMLDAAHKLIGKREWDTAGQIITGLMLLRREPVLTLMPSAIVVK